MTKIYLIRHAESVANTMGIYQGQTYDTDLSALGKNQAKALAQKFKSIQIGQIYSSPLKRTKQTAQEIAEATGLEIEIDLNLLETNHGDWEGMSKEEIKKTYNGKYEGWLTNPADVYFPRGETFCETVARAEAFLTSTIFDENTLVVTHDNIVRSMLAIIDGKEINSIWDYDLDPAGITEIEVDYTNRDRIYKILTINNTSHLTDLRADLSKHAL